MRQRPTQPVPARRSELRSPNSAPPTITKILKFWARWLASKTPENVAAWAAAAAASLLIAVESDAVLAVGGVKDDGEITLNYVAPKARFRGVSSALLNALEVRAVDRGAREFTLLSTETAHRFYLSRGYRDTAPSLGKFGMAVSYPMIKLLGSAAR